MLPLDIKALLQLIVEDEKDQWTPEEIRNKLITVLFGGSSPKPPNYEGKSICHKDEAFLYMRKSALGIYVPGLSGLLEPIADLLWEDEKLRAPLQMILYEKQHYPRVMPYKPVTVEEAKAIAEAIANK